MDIKIRFCENNKGKGKVIRQLEENFPNLNIKIKKCVKQCGSCRERPIAIVDKVKVSGSDSDDLYRQVAELIKRSTTV